jgi:FkbM family methyltransferase
MPSWTPEEQRRIEVTAAVRDTDAIPKVPDAGELKDVAGTRAQVMHNGVLIVEGSYQGAWMTEIIRRLHGHHEPQEEVAFHAAVSRLVEDTAEPVMVELGSYWAYYSLWLRHAIPAARSVMVEPDPSNLEAGRRNFALNGIEGEFVHGAIGGRHGGSIWLETESDGKPREIPTVTVDGLVRDKQLPRVDLLLCDIQGGEGDVLDQIAPLVRDGRTRFLVISTHHHSISGDPLTHQRCLEKVHGLGAHVIAEHSVSESCSGDGLICASADPRDRDLSVQVSHVRSRDSLFGEPEYELARALTLRAPLERAAVNVLRPARRRLRRRLARS